MDDALRRLLAAGTDGQRRLEARMATEAREAEEAFLNTLPTSRWVADTGDELVGDGDGDIDPARFAAAGAPVLTTTTAGDGGGSRAVRAEDLPFSTGLSHTLLAAMDSLGIEAPSAAP